MAREHGVPDTGGGPNRWSVDQLFLDQVGIPTIVELQRSTNEQMTRWEMLGIRIRKYENAGQ